MKRFLPKLGFNLTTLVIVVALIAIAVFPEHFAPLVFGAVPLGMGMAYVDAQLLFSDAQALTVTAVSTNIIDLGADRNIGIGEPMVVEIQVDVAAAGGGTLTITLQTDDNAAFGSPTTVVASAAIAAAVLVAGNVQYLPLPQDLITERFLRLNYTLATMTGITLTSFLTPTRMVLTPIAHYADNITIS